MNNVVRPRIDELSKCFRPLCVSGCGPTVIFLSGTPANYSSLSGRWPTIITAVASVTYGAVPVIRLGGLTNICMTDAVHTTWVIYRFIQALTINMFVAYKIGLETNIGHLIRPLS